MTAPPFLDVEQLLAQEPFLRSLARTLLGDEADEVVQRTWLRALDHRGRPVHEPRHWLARIARNVAHNLRRDVARRRRREQLAATGELVPSSAELLEREERRRSLVLAVDGLPPPLRTVVLLRWFENLQPREIAPRLGVTVAAVSNRLSRALALLRQRLDAEHGGDRRAWLVPLIPFATGRPATVSALGVTTAGVLLMTTKAKALCAVGLLLLAGVLWWAAAAPSSAPAAGPTAPPPVAALNAELPGNSAPLQPADAAQRSLAAPSVATPGRTELLVHAVYGDDHSPAADLLLIVGRDGEDPRIGPRRLLTDAQGNARLEGLAAGRVRVRSNHFVGAMDAEIRSGESTEVEFVLRGVDITGVVVDQGGATVQGAEVYLVSADDSDRDAELATTTGADGRFTLRACSANPLLVGARALGHAASKMQFLYASPQKDKKLDVRIELPGPGGGVEGVVVGPDQSPVADAVVRIGKGRLCAINSTISGAPALPAQIRTDRDGRYRAVGLLEGEHPIVVRAAGLAPWTGSCQVTANAITTLAVTLGAGLTVTGTIHDSDGALVPQATVTVGSEGELTNYRTLSGAGGTFHLTGLPTAEFEVVAARKGLGEGSAKLRGVAGGTLECDVQLTHGLVLRGRLLTESGEPVTQGGVSVTTRDAPRWSSSCSVDDEGRFTIDNCPEGRLLVVHAIGDGLRDQTNTRVDPHAGELLLRLKKTKALPPPSARVVGAILLPDGKPAVRFPVTLNGDITTTDASGHFEFGPLVPGMVRVDVDIDEFPVFRLQRVLVANDVWDLGTVRLAGGTVLVHFDGKTEGVRLVLYNHEGTWLVNVDAMAVPLRSRVVPPGRYQLRVSGPEIAAMSLPVTVRENEETIIDVRPQRGVARKIVFTAATGWQDIAWLDVTIAGGSEVRMQTIVGTDQEATPTLTCRLMPGSYTVTATGMMAASPIAQAEGRSGRAEFAVAEGGGEAAVQVEVR